MPPCLHTCITHVGFGQKRAVLIFELAKVDAFTTPALRRCDQVLPRVEVPPIMKQPNFRNQPYIHSAAGSIQVCPVSQP